MSTNGSDLTSCVIPKNINDMVEEAKMLAGALYKLMSNIPNCYVSLSARNHEGESLYVYVTQEDDEGQPLVDINLHHLDIFDPKEWRSIWEPEGGADNEAQKNNQTAPH